MQLNQVGLNFPDVRIGPLTEANRWSEKTVSKNEPTAIKQADLGDGKDAEVNEKHSQKSEPKECIDHGSKDFSATKCDMTTKEIPVEIHLERLVEIVRAGRKRCDFATPVVITKIEKDKKDENDDKDK